MEIVLKQPYFGIHPGRIRRYAASFAVGGVSLMIANWADAASAETLTVYYIR
jgi:hypothetical protein